MNDIQDAKNPALAEEYRSWFLKGRQADAFPADGLVQYPGSNAQRRNASQRYVLRKAHNLLFPDAELLSDVELSKLLNLVRQEVGVGRECAIVLDKLWHARDGHYRATQATIKTPRAWLLSVVRRGLLPPPEKAVAEPAAEGTHPDEADYQEFRVNKGAADLFGLSVEEVA